jgi:hypothetical protein
MQAIGEKFPYLELIEKTELACKMPVFRVISTFNTKFAYTDYTD